MNIEHELGRVLAGHELDNETALAILNLTGEELKSVFSAADALNQKLNAGRVSFIHNMNVNYTNICEYFCSFCEFGKSKFSDDTYILSEADIMARVGTLPISEITFQGGLSDRVSFDQVLTLLKAMKRNRPDIHMHAFSPEEIHYYARFEGLSYRETVQKVHEAGMNSLCGTAAEILDDEIRDKICPTKIKTGQWLEIVETAHEMGLRSTVTIMFGHIEEPRHVVNHLSCVRDLQKRTGGFTEFIPLLFIPDHTRLGRRVKPKNRMEYAKKIIALGRLYFSKTIRNVQTSWVKLGLDYALDCLDLGANDMGGTLYYENITREAGGTNGEFTSLETFYEKIKSRGKVPILRDTLYTYQNETSEVVHDRSRVEKGSRMPDDVRSAERARWPQGYPCGTGGSSAPAASDRLRARRSDLPQYLRQDQSPNGSAGCLTENLAAERSRARVRNSSPGNSERSGGIRLPFETFRNDNYTTRRRPW